MFLTFDMLNISLLQRNGKIIYTFKKSESINNYSQNKMVKLFFSLIN